MPTEQPGEELGEFPPSMSTRGGQRSELQELPDREPSSEDRDRVVTERDRTAEDWDRVATERDRTAEDRDRTATDRDRMADNRDTAAEDRDRVAMVRDRIAHVSEGSRAAPGSVQRSSLARQEAASDRRQSSEDRRAGATERIQAELDRSTALTDRAAAARERRLAEVDHLTGVYQRGRGLLELRREVALAREAGRSLVLIVVGVDHLEAISEERGQPAGDRLLVQVATVMASKLRSYDLILRLADDQFACAVSGLNLAEATAWLAGLKATLGEGPQGVFVSGGVAELLPTESPEDLLGRAHTALYQERRQHADAPPVQIWQCGDLVVDESKHLVRRADVALSLTATEFRMLVILIRNCTRVVPHSQLLSQVWGYEGDQHLVDVHMSALRRKLEAPGSRIIHTIRGIGYVLRP